MENKEIKNTAVELNDDMLEDVSGGLSDVLKPIILSVDEEIIGRNLGLDAGGVGGC